MENTVNILEQISNLYSAGDTDNLHTAIDTLCSMVVCHALNKKESLTGDNEYHSNKVNFVICHNAVNNGYYTSENYGAGMDLYQTAYCTVLELLSQYGTLTNDIVIQLPSKKVVGIGKKPELIEKTISTTQYIFMKVNAVLRQRVNPATKDAMNVYTYIETSTNTDNDDGSMYDRTYYRLGKFVDVESFIFNEKISTDDTLTMTDLINAIGDIGLTEKQIIVFRKRMQGMSYPTIAQKMGISRQAVEKLRNKGLAKIHQYFVDNGHSENEWLTLFNDFKAMNDERSKAI